jgi:hypothetical protein
MSELNLTGWSKDSVRAFGHVTADDLDMARTIVRQMSPADRAVLSFALGELSRIITEEEDFRVTEARREARANFGGDRF